VVETGVLFRPKHAESAWRGARPCSRVVPSLFAAADSHAPRSRASVDRAEPVREPAPLQVVASRANRSKTRFRHAEPSCAFAGSLLRGVTSPPAVPRAALARPA
jgi:hypothetical protein